jgi:hypothetical protein
MIAKQLSSISVHKAAGPDNIPSWVLKDFAHILALPVSVFQEGTLTTYLKMRKHYTFAKKFHSKR